MKIETRLNELVRQENEMASGNSSVELLKETVLAETGLDSLGFATMLFTMEQEFMLDPFGGTDDIIYPETFGELIALYEGEQRQMELSVND